MTTLSIKTLAGGDAGTCEVNEAWLEREKGEQAVHDAVVSYLANQRAGTASTKTRGKVRGGGAKPYRQKGTGHARAGSTRSPIWRGGGTTFGPQPRSFSKKVNKRVKKLALRRAFTERIEAGDVLVIDQLDVTEPKTKAIVAALKGVEAGENVLIIDQELTENVRLAVRNLPKCEAVVAANVNVYQMLLHRKVVITSSGLESLGKRLG